MGGDVTLEVPVLYPAVVVAVGGPGGGAAPGSDVAITDMASPPAPWVAVPDVPAAIATLSRSVGAAPVAAVALAQLLRIAPARPAQEGLILESVVYSMLQSGPEFAAWRDGRRPSPTVGSKEPVLVERRDDFLDVTLNRPEVHNAYNRAMRDALCEALAVAAVDPTLRVRIAGRGPSFCSGGDLSEFGTTVDPASAHLVRTTRSPARLLLPLSGRVEATLHGACAGSGIELPAFAGRVLARPDTRIWLPELAMGLIPGAGGTVSLPRRIGRHRTAWLALSGSVIDAPTALAWGLVDDLSGSQGQ